METTLGSELLVHLPAVRAALGTKIPSQCKSAGLRRAAAIAAALVLCAGAASWQRAYADDQTPGSNSTSTTDKEKKKKDESVEEVIVTGSLIPQSQSDNYAPVTAITAEDLKNRGFTSIADALQQTSFATGSVQGPQFAGFTQGALTLSLFGLDPSYVKYLIDGLPMGDYPALYNGTENITSIAGVPIELVDHIDVLPGGQSSIYGSDAIAGVVNIIMKKQMDGPVADLRYGYTADGGGLDKRLALADGFTVGGLTVTVGGQYEKTTPIWGFQRPLTSQYYDQGTSPQGAAATFLVYGYYGPTGNGLNSNYFEDPADCANVGGLFGGSTHEVTLPNYGTFCGTSKAGFYTIDNGDEGTQLYIQATDDITSNIELYANALVNHDLTKFSAAGGSFFNTVEDSSSPYAYYYDPNLNDYINLQHVFSPEETGNINDIMDEDTTNAYRATLGLRGGLGSSDWKYDGSFTYMQQKLTEATHMLLTNQVEDFFAPIFGPSLGTSGFGTGIYTPDYAAFYYPVTPQQYASFSGYSDSYSYTEESLARGQLTNASLFQLPGGPAGLALVLEGGDQGWNYDPSPNYSDGEAFGYTSVAGSGHRSRWAGTSELRLPVAKMLTFTASGRYDDYKVGGGSVDKATFTLGTEFRPFHTLLFRGRYGTSFKAPTLADEFQGQSGFYQSVTDYYLCSKEGFTGTNIGNCPQFNESIFGATQGNPKLQPITAKNWDIGTVWSPLPAFSISLDYLHFGINNEITEQSTDLLSREDASCLLGQLVITSPTCVAVLSQVTRENGTGPIDEIFTPKVNVSEELVNAVALGANYNVRTSQFGAFEFQLSWNDMIDHEYQQYAGQAPYNLLTNPYESTEFKSKVNGSVTWTEGGLTATVYVNRVGGTPNYIADLYPAGYSTPGAGTLGVWTIYNVSAAYQFTPALQLQLVIDNVFGSMPPADHSYPGLENQPYNEFDYNVYGAAYYLELNYKLGK